MRRRKPKESIGSIILSVIVVSSNDQKTIKRSLSGLHKTLQQFEYYEVLVIDNASRDATTKRVRELQGEIKQLRLLVLSKPVSTETALMAGLDNAIGDYVFFINPLTDRPSLLISMYELLQSGNDLVRARFAIEKYLFLSPINRFLLKYFQLWYPRDFLVYLNYSAGFNRRVVNAFTKIRRKRKDISYLSNLIGFKHHLMKYQPSTRQLDKLRQPSLLLLLARVFTASLANSQKPLRLALLLALVASFLNFIFLIYVFLVYLIKHNVAEGWVTTSVIMGTMFLLLFLVLAILSEYILRIWDESHQEPSYFVSEESEISVPSADKLNVV